MIFPQRFEKFQSTLPVRGATGLSLDYGIVIEISIHAPREGSDIPIESLTESINISIHAPREGSDIGYSYSIR